MASFDEYELERLRHAFVKLSGGDSRVANLTLERIRYNFKDSVIEQSVVLLSAAVALSKLSEDCDVALQ